MAHAPGQSHHNGALSLKQKWDGSLRLVLGTSLAGALLLLVFVWDVSFCSALLPDWSRMDLAFLFTLSTFPLCSSWVALSWVSVLFLTWNFRYSVSRCGPGWPETPCGADCPWVWGDPLNTEIAWLFSIIVLFSTGMVAHAFSPSRGRWVFEFRPGPHSEFQAC